MIRRVLRIGRWVVDFIFATRGYDIDGILACLYDCGASGRIMRKAEDLMLGCEMEYASNGPEGLMYECGFNQGFTFSNSARERAVVVIGPTTSGAEFVNTLSHEIFHLSIAIVHTRKELGAVEIPAHYSCIEGAVIVLNYDLILPAFNLRPEFNVKWYFHIFPNLYKISLL